MDRELSTVFLKEKSFSLVEFFCAKVIDKVTKLLYNFRNYTKGEWICRATEGCA